MNPLEKQNLRSRFKKEAHGKWYNQPHKRFWSPKLDKSTETDVFEIVKKDDSIPIRPIVAATNISFGTVWCVLRNNNMRLRSIRTQPMLTYTHMQQRLEFCHVHAKNSWDEWIDIDEKWFDLVN